MKRKKGKRPEALSEKYPPSEPCSCDTCRAFCMRPGWWTVEEAVRVMGTGYGNRMMMEISPEFSFAVLAPAFRGCEGDFALQEHSKSGCNFLQEGLCELHGTNLMPLECRFCHHSRSGQGLICHNDIARDWHTREGQELVKRWASEYGLYTKYQIDL